MTEPYETPVGNTVDQFESFHDPAQGGNPVTLEVTLDVASDVVEGLASRPTLDEQGNLPADYVRRAKNGELMVARYIWDTDAGQTSSETSIVGSSKSYQKDPLVVKLVQSAMGSYAKHVEQTDEPGRAYVGRRRL